MPSKTLAVATAAVLGIVSGVLGAQLIPSGSDSDPLKIGAQYANLGCSGEAVLMVGWGNAPLRLAQAVADNSASTVRYLQPRLSCDTSWRYQPADATHHLHDPHWVVYVGPFHTRQEACDLRMSGPHKGDFVTVLDDNTTDMVQCVCYVDVVTAPPLHQGMTNTSTDSIWIRQLQQILTDAGEYTKPVSGYYDQATADAVTQEQGNAGLGKTGVVDTDTWRAIHQSNCSRYTS